MIITEKLREGKISFYFLLLAIFFLPVWRNIFVIALWPWFFFWILEGLFFTGFRMEISRDSLLRVIVLPLLFLITLISLLWTENITDGTQRIGRQVLLVIIPIVLGLGSQLGRDNQRINIILKVYALGAVLSTIFLWVYGLANALSLENGKLVFDPSIGLWENVFYYHNFSFLIHPTYFGMMILMATSVILSWIEFRKGFAKKNIWITLLSLYLLSTLYFVSSRTMIIAAIGLLCWFILSKVGGLRIMKIIMFVVLAGLVSIASIHPRIHHLLSLLKSEERNLSFQNIEEVNDRVKIWNASFILIKQDPMLGAGVGDVKDSLIEKYEQMGYFQDSDMYLNCHNQFLESWVSVGILGFLLIAFSLLYPILGSANYNRFLFGAFFIICTAGFMFESVLNRLWGVAFFSIFYILLTSQRQGIKATE